MDLTKKGGKWEQVMQICGKRKKRQQRRVGHEENGSSSNRPELATFVLALRGTPVTKSHALFVRQPSNAVKRWVGESGKATLVRAPDADLLWEAIEELWQTTTAGAATFLV